MRDPNRLDDLYVMLLNFHKIYVPDWRFGQFMSNLLGKIYQETGRDIFFMEDGEMKDAIERVCQKWKGSDAS